MWLLWQESHTEDVYRKKQRDKKIRHGESNATRSVTALEQEVLTLFRCLNDAASSAFGTTALLVVLHHHHHLLLPQVHHPSGSLTLAHPSI